MEALRTTVELALATLVAGYGFASGSLGVTMVGMVLLLGALPMPEEDHA